MGKIKNLVRQAAVRGFHQIGYEVTPAWKVPSKPLVDHLKAVFRVYSIDTVLDVGANLGQFRSLLREDVGFKGRIVSFEPVSKYYETLLRKTGDDPNWSVHGFALGREAGEARINVTKSPGLNSFLSPRTDQVRDFWAADEVTHQELVKIRTLDEVLPECGVDCRRDRVYLKLDTQGFDVEVLNGGTKSLPGICALQTEASIKPIYEGMPNYLESVSALSGQGFDVSGLFPVTIDERLRLIEFDCVMVSRKIADDLETCLS